MSGGLILTGCGKNDQPDPGDESSKPTDPLAAYKVTAAEFNNLLDLEKQVQSIYSANYSYSKTENCVYDNGNGTFDTESISTTFGVDNGKVEKLSHLVYEQYGESQPLVHDEKYYIQLNNSYNTESHSFEYDFYTRATNNSGVWGDWYHYDGTDTFDAMYDYIYSGNLFCGTNVVTYSEMTFNKKSKSYKLASKHVEYHTYNDFVYDFTNIEIKFENKKVKEISYTYDDHDDCIANVVINNFKDFGTTTVTMPELL